MAEKKKPTGLAAYMDGARPPAPATTPTPARRASRSTPRPRPAPAATRPRGRSAPAQGERINLTYRASTTTWERLKQLAVSDRTSIQELIHAALSREFQRRGLAPLAD